MNKWLRAALKLVTDRSKSDTCHYRLIVEIEHFALRVAILDECKNYLGGGGRFGKKREK